MTNNNVPQNLHTESNQGLSITGPVESLLLSSERIVNNDPWEIAVIHDASTTEGSQDNPIMVDSIPEQTISVTPKIRNSRPRRNVPRPTVLRKSEIYRRGARKRRPRGVNYLILSGTGLPQVYFLGQLPF